MKPPREILDFWFSDRSRKRWYNSTPAFDAEILERFEDTAKTLAEGPFPNPIWEADPQSSLALVISLDQFPRNMYRGTPDAFAWDQKALAVAERMVEAGWDQAVTEEQRAFVYMPFMHAENLASQERSVKLCGSLDDANTLRHAIAHRDVIARFGRFPHRNKVLGRQSTDAERAFLADGGYDPS